MSKVMSSESFSLACQLMESNCEEIHRIGYSTLMENMKPGLLAIFNATKEQYSIPTAAILSLHESAHFVVQKLAGLDCEMGAIRLANPDGLVAVTGICLTHNSFAEIDESKKECVRQAHNWIEESLDAFQMLNPLGLYLK